LDFARDNFSTILIAYLLGKLHFKEFLVDEPEYDTEPENHEETTDL
jgi:hypothetical protein